MKIPEARERAESESLDILVDLGRVCLSKRRIHAAGGSKSCVVDDVEEVVLFVVTAAAADLLLAGTAALEDSMAVIIDAAATAAEAAIDCCSVVEEEGAAGAEAEAAAVVSMVVSRDRRKLSFCWIFIFCFFHRGRKRVPVGLRKDFPSRLSTPLSLSFLTRELVLSPSISF